jgi:hypothetical protein
MFHVEHSLGNGFVRWIESPRNREESPDLDLNARC